MINYRYCPQCATRLTKDGGRYFCEHCRLHICRSATPTAGVLPVKGNQVLLARRGVEPHKGSYDTIGGFLEYGEDPKAGALREAKEESGLDLKLMRPLGVYSDYYQNQDAPHIQIICTLYIAEIVGDSTKMRAQDDVTSLHWVAIEDPPLQQAGFKNTKQALRDLQKWHRKTGGLGTSR